jgi:leader peptidase (prepilin peptidase)/N-methyltransferase
MAELPFWIFIVILGLALGSFTTCAVYRIPRGISIWRRGSGEGAYRSHCPSCNAVLGARDLIPILSWLVLRGRCRHCGANIGVRYLLIEISVLILVLGIALVIRS